MLFTVFYQTITLLIMRKYFFSLILSLTLSAISVAQQSFKKPNIIYILADDLGYGDLSSLNKNSKIKTSHIDALAKQGMKFTDAHSNSAVCTPTRYGILTGRYAWRTKLQNGVTWSYDDALIDNNRTTVASFLKEQGYTTACIGKWHLGMNWPKNNSDLIDFFGPIENGPIEKGFDYFYGIPASLDIPPYVYIKNNQITATKIDTIKGTSGKGFWREGPIGNDFKHATVLSTLTDNAIEYIATSKTNKPYFLYLPLPAPHTPILPSKEYLGKSNTNEYGDFVLMLDDMIGKIMDAVKKRGDEQNTMIIFTSDNGCSLAADFKELEKVGHNPSFIFRGAKSDIFEGGHRIPFIVKWPNTIAPNSVSETTICLTDFLATCADLLHQKLPDNTAEDSFSILPLLASDSKEKYKRNAIVHHSIDGNFSIRKGKWKLEFCAGSGGWAFPTAQDLKKLNLPALQLYNLENDISEKENIADKNPLIVKELTLLMKKYIDDGRSTAGLRQENDVEIKLNK